MSGPVAFFGGKRVLISHVDATKQPASTKPTASAVGEMGAAD
jgi:hypothetical protein